MSYFRGAFVAAALALVQVEGQQQMHNMGVEPHQQFPPGEGITVSFINTCEAPINLYYLNTVGGLEEVFLNSFNPGQAWTDHTTPGHTYRVKWASPDNRGIFGEDILEEYTIEPLAIPAQEILVCLRLRQMEEMEQMELQMGQQQQMNMNMMNTNMQEQKQMQQAQMQQAQMQQAQMQQAQMQQEQMQQKQMQQKHEQQISMVQEQELRRRQQQEQEQAQQQKQQQKQEQKRQQQVSMVQLRQAQLSESMAARFR